jgi:uncharacterized protein DUF3187
MTEKRKGISATTNGARLSGVAASSNGCINALFARLAIIFALALAPNASRAGDDFDPFPTSDRSPFVQVYGLPALDGPRLLPAGQSTVRLTAEVANNFVSMVNERESLFLDGETHRTALVVQRGTVFGEWGIEVPYVTHGGGFMDSFIESWHNTFDFPNGGREQFPQNQLAYVYRRDGIDRVRLVENARGVGDVQLLGGWHVPSEKASWDVALRASIKLPTGDSSTLLGSGATDVAFWVTAGCATGYCPNAVRWNFSGGLIGVGRGDVLPELQRSAVAFGGATIGWEIWQPLVLKAQLLVHTSFYRGSDIRLFDATPAQLVFGGTLRLSGRTALDVGISEDINVRTAPDVTLLVNLRASF